MQKRADISWVSGRIHMSTVILCILLRLIVGFQFIFNTKRPLKAWPTGQLGNDWNSHCCAPSTFPLLLGSWHQSWKWGRNSLSLSTDGSEELWVSWEHKLPGTSCTKRAFWAHTEHLPLGEWETLGPNSSAGTWGLPVDCTAFVSTLGCLHEKALTILTLLSIFPPLDICHKGRTQRNLACGS